MRTVAPNALRLADYVRGDSRVVAGHSTAEPATLLEAFVAQRADYTGARLLLHASFSTIVQPEHADCLVLQAFGAVGTQARLAKEGVLDIIPAHLSDIPRMIGSSELLVDVVLVSVSPPDSLGRYSLGLVHDYLWSAARRARVVIAEMNSRTPFTEGGPYLSAEDIDVIVPVERDLTEVPPGHFGDTERAIAAHVAKYVEDGAVIQLGIGAIPNAVAASLGGFRDLGIHSGVVSNALVDLVESGAVTNARKTIDKGISVTGSVWGTRELYNFVDRNPALHVRASTYTHAQQTLAQLRGFVSINSAIEIDVSGQANLEIAGGLYIGAVGGAVDFVRGAHIAPSGKSIIALPSTAAGGKISRIVTDLGGPATIARSDIDIVITEYGSAELRGQSLIERTRRLTAIAHPDFRETLERSATNLS